MPKIKHNKISLHKRKFFAAIDNMPDICNDEYDLFNDNIHIIRRNKIEFLRNMNQTLLNMHKNIDQPENQLWKTFENACIYYGANRNDSNIIFDIIMYLNDNNMFHYLTWR